MLRTDAPVCVTGANGFIATELIASLLARGLTVHGTVRSAAPSRTAHLLALPGAEARLKLFEADLGGPPAAFTAAAAGCNVVFHTACPFVYSGRAAALGEEYFVGPAVKGTEAVLAACRDAGSVTRVVMTSSCAAIFKKDVPEGHVYDENSWNDPEELATRKMWYSIGKTKQERAAWAWVEAEKPAFSLVCINPCMVAGGARQPVLNASQENMADLCSGAKALIPNMNMPWVHLSDVVKAHVEAGDQAHASGRYVMIASWVHLAETCAVLAELFPALAPNVPTEVDAAAPRAPPSFSSSARVEALLGAPLLPLRAIVADSVASLLQWGHVVAPGAYPPHCARVVPGGAFAPRHRLLLTWTGGAGAARAQGEGVEVTPTQAASQPHVALAPPPPAEALFTLILSDPDAPSVADPKFGEWQHWVVVNVPGSRLGGGGEGVGAGAGAGAAAAPWTTLTAYFGPAPGKDSGRHRYCAVAYEQTRGAIDTAGLPVVGAQSGFPPRRSFKSAEFAAAHGLTPVAALTFPCEWDAMVPELAARLAPPA